MTHFVHPLHSHCKAKMYTRTHGRELDGVHHTHMVKRAGPRPKKVRRKNYIREWRKHRGKTLEQIASQVGMTHASLSRVERGLQDYTEGLLEALAAALNTDVPSLLMRDPSDPDAIWSLWDQAKPAERRQIIEITKTLLKTGS